MIFNVMYNDILYHWLYLSYLMLCIIRIVHIHAYLNKLCFRMIVDLISHFKYN